MEPKWTFKMTLKDIITVSTTATILCYLYNKFHSSRIKVITILKSSELTHSHTEAFSCICFLVAVWLEPVLGMEAIALRLLDKNSTLCYVPSLETYTLSM